MSWGGIAEFVNMGGYGLYVWGSYLVTLGLLATEAGALLRRERTTLARLKRELAAGAGR